MNNTILININKELNNKGIIEFVPEENFVPNDRLPKIQEIISNVFTNFNGGYGGGIFVDENHYSKFWDINFANNNSIPIFTFVINDISRDYKYNFSSPYIDKSNHVIKLPWQEVVLKLVKMWGIPFYLVFDNDLIDRIYKHYLENFKNEI